MPLVFLPDVDALFFWGEASPPRVLPSLGHGGEAWSAALVTPTGHRDVEGRKLPLFETMAELAVVAASEVESLPGSVATWVFASKLAMDLVARERVVPTITRRGGRIERLQAPSPGLRPRATRRLRALHLGFHLFRGHQSLRDGAISGHFSAEVSMLRFLRISAIVKTRLPIRTAFAPSAACRCRCRRQRGRLCRATSSA